MNAPRPLRSTPPARPPSHRDARAAWTGVLVALAVAFGASGRAANAPLTCEEAVALALRQSKGTQISALKAVAAEAGAANARRQRYPRVEAFGLSGYYFRPLDVQLRQGALSPLLDHAGRVLGLGPLSTTLGPFPPSDLTLVRGNRVETIGGITVLQPLSPLWRINSGVEAARAESATARRESSRTGLQIRDAVERLFAGIIVEEARQSEHAARVAQLERQRHDAENARRAGELLDDAVLGLNAALIEARTDLARSRQQRARLVLQLEDLVGRAADEPLVIVPALPPRPQQPLAYWLARVDRNPDRQIAAATASRARAGTRAARQAYIPEVSAFATAFAQDGLPLLPDNGATVGVTLTWDVFDFGRRRADVARARALQRAAEIDGERLEQDAARNVRIAYQDFTHAGELSELAEQAVAYRRRAAELAQQGAARGLQLAAKALEAEAALRKAEADLVGARIQRHLALLKLYSLVGE